MRQETAAFPPRCATTPFGGSPPYYSHSELLILKVFGEGGSDVLPLLLVLLLQIHY